MLYDDGSGAINLTQSTITNNNAYTEGGGIVFASANPITLTGTILTNDFKGNFPATGSAVQGDVISASSGTTITSNHSIFGEVGGTTANVTLTDTGGSIRTSDPGVNPLANNGGPTTTMSLLASSPAINTGPMPVASFTGNQFDQRGTGYPRVNQGLVDIGAYEWSANDPTPTTTTTAPGPTTTTSTVPGPTTTTTTVPGPTTTTTVDPNTTTTTVDPTPTTIGPDATTTLDPNGGTAVPTFTG